MEELTLQRIRAKAKGNNEKENIIRQINFILFKFIINNLDEYYYDENLKEFYQAAELTREYLRKIKEIK